MADGSVCEHTQVTRSDYVHNKPFWKCDRCNAEFVPGFAVAGMADVMATDRVDMIASAASAMLWDFHERAVEKYGKQVAEAIEPSITVGDRMFEYSPDTCPEHEWHGGQCSNCGVSQWLGS